MGRSKLAAFRGRFLTVSIFRLLVALVAVGWLTQFVTQPVFFSALLAQEDKNPTVGADLDATPSAPGSTTTGRASKPVLKHRTFLDSIKAGGYIGVIIILMSVVAVAFVIEHGITIRKERLMPEALMDQLEDLVARGELQTAVQLCEDPR